MRQFRIYQYMSETPVAVKIGFSWPSFFFTWIWAIVKGCWPAFWLLAAYSIACTLSWAVAEATGSAGVMLLVLAVQVGLSIWFSTFMNDWRARSLEKKGYRLVGNVSAANPSAAVAQMWQQARAVPTLDTQVPSH